MVLEQCVENGSEDKNVYLNLFYYYRKNARFHDLYRFMLKSDSMIQDAVDKYFCLTRRLFAELLVGASTHASQSDPVVFATTHGYLRLLPDGKFYEHDTITHGNLIILLDRLVDQVYPTRFFTLRNIPNRSFLYLPYMRLVELGILELDESLEPHDAAPISVASHAIAQLKKRGLID
jgi:hypothetical protein